ncbi:MAG: undecaprenyl-diphosphate phosphatase [Actinomycetia bacterium]|nr:undecaprenyl-diphosphate phosphatase [Actinomycetes bacterium]
MQWWHAVILGIVEGVSEFLPISSTGHLTVVEELLGYDVADVGITAFTAVIQSGAILAAVVYFWRDIVRLAAGFCRGLVSQPAREQADFRLGLGVIVGVVPAVIVGLAFKGVIEGPLRSLWVVAGGLIVWSLVMWLADRHSARQPQPRGEETLTVVDALVIGLWQCISVVPGVSRSGATISGALLRGIDRVTATRWSFFLGIPTLLGAGILETATEAPQIASTVGWGSTGIGIAVSFVVAYASIAWLLKFVQSNTFSGFVVYRLLAGAAIMGLLTTGLVA